MGALKFFGEESCQTEAEGNEAEAAEKRREPRPSAIAAFSAASSFSLPRSLAFRACGRARPLWPSRKYPLGPLGRGDARSPLGTVSERSGSKDAAGLAEGGPWLATAREASGLEDPWLERFPNPIEDVSLTQRIQGSSSAGFPVFSGRAVSVLSISRKSLCLNWTSTRLDLGDLGCNPLSGRAHPPWPG